MKSWLLGFLVISLLFVSSCVLFPAGPCQSADDCPGNWVCFRNSQCVPPYVQERLAKNEPSLEVVPEQKSCVGSCTLGEKRECYSEQETGCTQSGGAWSCKGICKVGQQVCALFSAGECPKWGDCVGVTVPESKEACDGKDNNCNGTIDEGCKCVDGEQRPCYTGVVGCKPTGDTYSCKGSCQYGKKECSKGKWGLCQGDIQPGKEVCDGKDNDCNGLIDDALSSPKCPEQLGLCKDSYQICGGEKGWLTCDSAAYGKAYESKETKCDGIDNDCDGLVDNGLAAPPCTKQKGACSGSGKSCGGKQGWLACDVSSYKTNKDYEETETTCDGIDNDCDGKTDEGCVITVTGIVLNGKGVKGIADGPASTASFNRPNSIAFDSLGNLYIAGFGTQKIRVLDTQGQVKTIAGTGDVGFMGGPAAQAKLFYPHSLTFDSKGQLYFSEYGNHVIRTLVNGSVELVAGTGKDGFVDGTPKQAQFNFLCGIAFSPKGELYIADYSNYSIRKIDALGKVTTVAGTGKKGFLDGTALQAKFANVHSLVFDKSGNLFISDFNNHSIRRLDTSGIVTTIAGGPSFGSKDGPGAQALFYYPAGLALDGAGNLYIADSYNHSIRKLNISSGNVTTVAGTGKPGVVDGPALQAQFDSPTGLAIDKNGDLYVSEGATIRKIILP